MVDVTMFNHTHTADRMESHPLHVLASTYMCAPNRGSEPGKSWNWVRHLAAHCRVTVITQGNQRKALDAWLTDHPLPNVRFVYVDGPPSLRVVRHEQTRYLLNYIAWQWRALHRAEQLLAEDPFDLAHHISFASITRPIFMQHLPVPLIFGPVGGGELGHQAFWGEGGLTAGGYELLRSSRVKLINFDPLIRSTIGKAALIVLTTPENIECIPVQHRNKVLVHPSIGIESDLARQPIQCSESGRAVYAAGRLVHWKGFHLAIRAFARVARRFPDATFTIVGDGPQRERLNQLIQDEGVGKQVRIERWLPRAEVLQLATESDIFLFPSLHDSGGLAVLEAMASAKPVICLDSGGPSLMVTPESGFKVPMTTPDQVVVELANALTCLLADANLRGKMAQAARQRVLDEYTWERKTERMVRVYREVVAAAKQRT